MNFLTTHHDRLLLNALAVLALALCSSGLAAASFAEAARIARESSVPDAES